MNWISVKDELPNNRGHYLVVHKNNGAAVGYWHEDESRWGIFFAGEITHWMPLPELPAEDKE